MGCGSSKNNLETVDDSVHVMIAHDKKVAAKKGQPANMGYKPRADHPLLHDATNDNDDKDKSAANDDAPTTATAANTEDGSGEQQQKAKQARVAAAAAAAAVVASAS